MIKKRDRYFETVPKRLCVMACLNKLLIVWMWLPFMKTSQHWSAK